MRWCFGCLVLAVACGGSSEDPVLEQELEAEASSGDEGVDMERRHRAIDTRVFGACYDNLAHLGDHARSRRELRVHRVRQAQQDAELPTGLAVDRRQAPLTESDELPSNVDATHHEYDADEQALIELEDRYDAYHNGHAHPNEWTDEELTEFEDLADSLYDACMRIRHAGV